jgi:L-cystine uptake protein TcyP (sodium:dicarboxylate symporter family)
MYILVCKVLKLRNRIIERLPYLLLIFHTKVRESKQHKNTYKLQYCICCTYIGIYLQVTILYCICCPYIGIYLQVTILYLLCIVRHILTSYNTLYVVLT